MVRRYLPTTSERARWPPAVKLLHPHIVLEENNAAMVRNEAEVDVCMCVCTCINMERKEDTKITRMNLKYNLKRCKNYKICWLNTILVR